MYCADVTLFVYRRIPKTFRYSCVNMNEFKTTYFKLDIFILRNISKKNYVEKLLIWFMSKKWIFSLYFCRYIIIILHLFTTYTSSIERTKIRFVNIDTVFLSDDHIVDEQLMMKNPILLVFYNILKNDSDDLNPDFEYSSVGITSTCYGSIQ